MVSDCLPWKRLDRPPGGSPVDVEGASGTICAPFHVSSVSTAGWIGSGHVAINGGDDAYQGNGDWIPGGNNHIGNEKFAVQTGVLDYSYFTRTTLLSAHIGDQNDLSDDLKIIGRLTDDALENSVGSDTIIQTQGGATCRREGSIEAVNADVLGNKEVWINQDGFAKHVEGGDSGGPMFWENPNSGKTEVYIAGIIRRWDVETEFPDPYISKGTTAQSVESDAGGYFISY